MPAYSVAEAAHYLGIPTSTVRYWVAGREGLSRPLIVTAAKTPVALSFLNLVELHVLGAIRREHEVSLPKVRIAIEFLKKQYKSKHPLASHELETDGLDLFVAHYGQLINISSAGQMAMRQVLETSLKRIERDNSGIPIKLYPFTRNDIRRAPKLVVIDPQMSFGRPVIAGTGLATEIIAERYKAGESIDSLAQDYGRKNAEIEEAIRCELEAA
jgi:uncharacterized protein (DUF433 family)/transposase-like protein